MNVLQLIHQLLQVQCHAVANDIGHMGVERAGGQDVEGEAAIIIDDGVAGVGTALEACHDVGMFRQHIRDLPLAFIAPVGAYDCFYHDARLLIIRIGNVRFNGSHREPHDIIRKAEWKCKVKINKIAVSP